MRSPFSHSVARRFVSLLARPAAYELIVSGLLPPRLTLADVGPSTFTPGTNVPAKADTYTASGTATLSLGYTLERLLAIFLPSLGTFICPALMNGARATPLICMASSRKCRAATIHG